MQRYIKQEMQEARVQEQEKGGFRVTFLYTGAVFVASVAWRKPLQSENTTVKNLQYSILLYLLNFNLFFYLIWKLNIAVGII